MYSCGERLFFPNCKRTLKSAEYSPAAERRQGGVRDCTLFYNFENAAEIFALVGIERKILSQNVDFDVLNMHAIQNVQRLLRESGVGQKSGGNFGISVDVV